MSSKGAWSKVHFKEISLAPVPRVAQLGQAQGRSKEVSQEAIAVVLV